MGFLSDMRNSRRELSTKVKAAKAKAKTEAKLEAKLNKAAYKQGRKDRAKQARKELKAAIKSDRKRAKLDAKAAKRADKLQAKGLKRTEKLQAKGDKREAKNLKAKHRHQEKIAASILEQKKQRGLSKDNVNKYVGAGRVMAPVAIPLAYRAITWLQNRNQESEARKFGVTADAAARFAGHGAPLRARIESIRGSLGELREAGRAPVGFVRDAEDRLDTLVKAVRNAEHMSPDQRRRVHRTIAGELDGLDAQIMGHLGIRA